MDLTDVQQLPPLAFAGVAFAIGLPTAQFQGSVCPLSQAMRLHSSREAVVAQDHNLPLLDSLSKGSQMHVMPRSSQLQTEPCSRPATNQSAAAAQRLTDTSVECSAQHFRGASESLHGGSVKKGRILNAFELAAAQPRGVPNSHNPPGKRGPRSTCGTGLVLNSRGLWQAPLRPRAEGAANLTPREEWIKAGEKRRAISKASI